MLYPPGFYVKKPKRFVILSSDKSSERNLSCFFDIKPRRGEHSWKEGIVSSEYIFSSVLFRISGFYLMCKLICQKQAHFYLPKRVCWATSFEFYSTGYTFSEGLILPSMNSKYDSIKYLTDTFLYMMKTQNCFELGFKCPLLLRNGLNYNIQFYGVLWRI